MSKIEQVKKELNEKNASLVVYKNGTTTAYYQDRIKDLIAILTQDKEAILGATVGDKIIGKVAMAIMIQAGVKEIYTEKISKLALPLLEKTDIMCEYQEVVEHIENKDKTGMCPMEARFQKETDTAKIYNEFIK